ncbi:hypothetical protein [Latilactobacillus curvatus]|uniref:hypothetical protein n=1 Tax=Latilactobacillus curvatus TaxID=28038 RepID=UPI00217D2F3C|nr:hypothetical protein [Latilactobacillus curvatus]
MNSKREHEMALAFASGMVNSEKGETNPSEQLTIFEDAYVHALDLFEGKYPDQEH